MMSLIQPVLDRPSRRSDHSLCTAPKMVCFRHDLDLEFGRWDIIIVIVIIGERIVG